MRGWGGSPGRGAPVSDGQPRVKQRVQQLAVGGVVCDGSGVGRRKHTRRVRRDTQPGTQAAPALRRAVCVARQQRVFVDGARQRRSGEHEQRARPVDGVAGGNLLPPAHAKQRVAGPDAHDGADGKASVEHTAPVQGVERNLWRRRQKAHRRQRAIRGAGGRQLPRRREAWRRALR